MAKKSFLFISCDEAYHICDKAQYGEASLWEKIKLNLRYVWCQFTQGYVKRNKKLTHAFKVSNIHTLHPSERELMNGRFNQQLKNRI